MCGYLQDTVLSPLAVSVSLVLLVRLALLVSLAVLDPLVFKYLPIQHI